MEIFRLQVSNPHQSIWRHLLTKLIFIPDNAAGSRNCVSDVKASLPDYDEILSTADYSFPSLGSSSSHVRGGQCPTFCLIFIDAKDSNPMQLWQLGDKHSQERGCVEDKVCWIILCIETCQEVQNYRRDCEELPWRCELYSIIQLFPVC